MLRFARRVRLTGIMKESEFIRLVMPLRDRMFRYAQSLVLSSAEAEDVVHDLLERMWRDRERMELPQHVGAFVMTAVRNRCCDLLRRRQADVRWLAQVKASSEWVTESVAQRWEAREVVRRAMASLPERQREVIHLKEIEGFRTCEIAEVIGCGEAQVRVILSRGRAALRGILQKLMNDGRTTNTH